MFGFSFAELILVIIVGLIFIKPQDLPEIAHFCGRVLYRGKSLFKGLKQSFKEIESELGVDDLKHELNRGIAEEKAKIDKETTVIVDMYGNEHHVPNVHQVRPDMDEEEIKKEIEKYNSENNQSSKK
jgi:Sec-independent protein translocase protein TatA